jgi:hypothetical protein
VAAVNDTPAEAALLLGVRIEVDARRIVIEARRHHVLRVLDRHRVTVIERLLQANTSEVRSEIIKQNINLFDEQFFGLFSRLAQGAAGSGQEPVARAMVELQKQLLEETEFGRQLKESVGELEAATKVLQDAGQGLTREKLLDIVIESQSDARLRAYVSLARGGMDYQFFQLLTDKIDKASGDEKAKFESMREKLLGFTGEVDKQMEARYKGAQDLVERILSQDDVVKAVQDNIQNITQDVVDIARTAVRVLEIEVAVAARGTRKARNFAANRAGREAGVDDFGDRGEQPGDAPDPPSRQAREELSHRQRKARRGWLEVATAWSSNIAMSRTTPPRRRSRARPASRRRPTRPR